jgi:lambda family phage portal protein
MIGGILDKTISVFAPGWGLRRMHARRVQRTYSGAEANRLNNQKRPKNQAADQELLGPFGADALRAWARALVRDNAYAWNALDTIVSNIVGEGITAQSTFETTEGEDVEDVNDHRDSVFAEWCEVCDINGELTFSEMQVLCQREMAEAGEVLIRYIRTSSKEYRGIRRPVPLALEVIEADRLSLERDTFHSRVARENGNRIIRGVEIDDKGKPVAYWIYPEHPNSPYTLKSQTPERIPASDIIHLYRKDRVGQSRGVSWFAPVMSHVRDLGVYIDNEMQASTVASCFSVAIKTVGTTPGLYGGDDDDATDANGNTFEYIEPGAVARLNPGESIESINPGRPNSASEPWIRLLLRGICAGTGTSYESVSKDFSNTSYSSSRTSKLDDRPRYKRWQNYLINHFCQPVWDEFCNAAAREGLDKFPASSELLEDRRKVTPVEWQRPEWEWVDPSSEQTAASESLGTFMSTYQDELGARGRSWRATFYQAAKERRLRIRLGLLTAEEQTSQMMATQTGAEGPADAVAAEESHGTGEWMGLSRLQLKNNDKALNDILTGLADQTMSTAVGEAKLAMIGMSQKNIAAVIADVTDGVIDQPPPANEEAEEVPVE